MSSTTEHSKKIHVEIRGGGFIAENTKEHLRLPPECQVEKSLGERENLLEIPLTGKVTKIRDDNKNVIFKFDEKGNLIDRTPKKLTKNEVKEIMEKFPEAVKYLSEEIKSAERVEER